MRSPCLFARSGRLHAVILIQAGPYPRDTESSTLLGTRLMHVGSCDMCYLGGTLGGGAEGTTRDCLHAKVSCARGTRKCDLQRETPTASCMPSIRYSASKRIYEHARTSSSGSLCGSKFHVHREWMRRYRMPSSTTSALRDDKHARWDTHRGIHAQRRRIMIDDSFCVRADVDQNLGVPGGR